MCAKSVSLSLSLSLSFREVADSAATTAATPIGHQKKKKNPCLQQRSGGAKGRERLSEDLLKSITCFYQPNLTARFAIKEKPGSGGGVCSEWLDSRLTSVRWVLGYLLEFAVCISAGECSSG